MKVLFVHERLGAFGGAEANLFLTAAEMRQRAHEVALLHGAPTSHGTAEWLELFSPAFPLSQDAGPAAVHDALKQFQPDLIYVHKMADLEVLSALVSSATPRVRMVHDHDLYCMRSYKYNFFTRRICRRPVSPYCLFPCGAFLARRRRSWFPFKWISYRAKKRELRLNRQFHRLLVATDYMADELVRNGFDPDRIEVHPPVTHDPEHPFTSAFGGRNRVLFVGQIIRGKGVDVLLEALAQLTEPFECLIFGEGHHRPYCERLSQKLGLAERVQFKGFVPQHELLAYYRDTTVVVVSSVWPEPFGAAGLEGMRYGLPVVAFDAGGIREWLTDGWNGFLVPWMDRTRFAARVQQLLLQKELARQMGERGRQMVQQNHTLPKYIDALEQTFARVISETRETVPA